MISSCVACGSGEHAKPLTKGVYTYSVCARCGTASLEEGWEQADYESGYFTSGFSHGYYDYGGDRRLHLETAGRRLDALATVVHDTHSLVDVGAALGFTLEEGRRRGMEVVGVERSQYASNLLRERGFEVHPTLADLHAASSDGVVLGQVLEHMPDPRQALEDAFEALRPGGGLFVETWDFSSSTARRFGDKWQQVSPPSVVHLFTADGLRSLLERAGFIDVEIRPWQKRVSVNVILGVVAAKTPAPVGKALMWTAKTTRVARIAVSYRFDDLVAVTARKPV